MNAAWCLRRVLRHNIYAGMLAHPHIVMAATRVVLGFAEGLLTRTLHTSSPTVIRGSSFSRATLRLAQAPYRSCHASISVVGTQRCCASSSVNQAEMADSDRYYENDLPETTWDEDDKEICTKALLDSIQVSMCRSCRDCTVLACKDNQVHIIHIND